MTALVPVTVVPVIVTVLPTGPLLGLKPLIVGGMVTVKLLLLVAWPLGVARLSGPLLAPLGTVALIWVCEVTVLVALAALRLTARVLGRLVPVLVSVPATGPLVGLTPLIVGGTVTVKLLLLVAWPLG